ncbi:MAG: hypothetical protein Q8R70_07210 [Methanoregula sp.]|nr:hypothetical protein [Methanoregula sp.]
MKRDTRLVALFAMFILIIAACGCTAPACPAPAPAPPPTPTFHPPAPGEMKTIGVIGGVGLVILPGILPDHEREGPGRVGRG